MRLASMLVFTVLMCGSAHALSMDAPLKEPALETRAQSLFASLRCVVCAGQTLADSDVAMAKDMRLQVRKMVSAGASNDDIISYFVSRYGEEVLTAPRLQSALGWLWLLPFCVLSVAAFSMMRMLRKSRI